MWDNIYKTALSSASEFFSNASRGASGAITFASKYLSNTTPPPQVIVDPALEAARKQERWEKDTTLNKNFLLPDGFKKFPSLPDEEKKEIFTALINDLRNLKKDGYNIPKEIETIITRHNQGYVSDFEDYKTLNAIKNYYYDVVPGEKNRIERERIEKERETEREREREKEEKEEKDQK